MTATTSTPVERRLTPAVLVGGAFALSTVLNIAIHVGEILFTDHDPHASGGAIESIESIGLVGAVGIVLALAIALPLARDPYHARVGAIVLGVLTVISLPVFWSGASASLGACAAWLGGLARGSHPQGGAARGFGVVGLVVVILSIVAVLFGGILGALVS